MLLLAVLLAAGSASPPPALAAFAQTWSSMPGYTATVQLFEQKGSADERSTFTYTFSKPSHVTAVQTQGKNAGATVKWDGGTTVAASKKGAFGISMTKNVPLNDPLVTSLRGYTIADLSFGAILAHAQQTPGTLSETPATIGGTAVQSVTLTVADPSADGGMTREVLYLSPTTHLPVRVDGFVGSQMVRSYQFTLKQ